MLYILLIWLLIFLLIKYLSKDNEEKDINFVESKKRESKRRINEKEYNSTLFKKDKEEILVKYNYKCFKCGSKKNLTLDHHMPLSLGYGFEKGNIVLLCRSCNKKKGHLLPVEFYTPIEMENLKEKYNIDSHEKLKKYKKNEYKSILNKIKDFEGKDVIFYYLGKVVKGQLLRVVVEEKKELYKNREKYVEVLEGNEINIYKLKGIKEIYIDESKRG